MFSWSKKKDSRKGEKKGGRDSEENEFGFKMDKGPSDKQLEAELRALAGTIIKILSSKCNIKLCFYRF